MNRRTATTAVLLIVAIAMLIAASSKLSADTGTCAGVSVTLPFNDVMGNAFFCQIAEAYFSGLTSGTTATTYSPANNVTREQMAAFITRTLDQALKRGSRRAAFKKLYTPPSIPLLGRTSVGDFPLLVDSDGADLWVANYISGSVSRVRASDGKLLETWTGADAAWGVLAASGRVFITGDGNPGRLYAIDPTQAPGPVSTLANNLGDNGARGLAFDGFYLWVACRDSVSRVDPNTGAMTNYATGFSFPVGMIYDGANIWVTDFDDDTLKKLNADGSIVRTVSVGDGPLYPVFDGTNIWVPNFNSDSVTVVRVKDAQGNPLTDPFVLATLTGNGVDGPEALAFDGERVLATSISSDGVSLWKAADLTPLGFAGGGPSANPFGACSDGLNFWIALQGQDALVRF
jgi:DNA-binding beta-propeller fold protein YncE